VILFLASDDAYYVTGDSLRGKLTRSAPRSPAGRYITFQMAEVAVPRRLFVDIPGHCANVRRQRDTLAGDAFLRSSGSNASACQGHARSARNNHPNRLMRRQSTRLEFKLQEAPESENILT
jgi:hypothetical protein